MQVSRSSRHVCFILDPMGSRIPISSSSGWKGVLEKVRSWGKEIFRKIPHAPLPSDVLAHKEKCQSLQLQLMSALRQGQDPLYTVKTYYDYAFGLGRIEVGGYIYDTLFDREALLKRQPIAPEVSIMVVDLIVYRGVKRLSQYPDEMMSRQYEGTYSIYRIKGDLGTCRDWGLTLREMETKLTKGDVIPNDVYVMRKGRAYQLNKLEIDGVICDRKSALFKQLLKENVQIRVLELLEGITPKDVSALSVPIQVWKRDMLLPSPRLMTLEEAYIYFKTYFLQNGGRLIADLTFGGFTLHEIELDGRKYYPSPPDGNKDEINSFNAELEKAKKHTMRILQLKDEEGFPQKLPFLESFSIPREKSIREIVEALNPTPPQAVPIPVEGIPAPPPIPPSQIWPYTPESPKIPSPRDFPPHEDRSSLGATPPPLLPELSPQSSPRLGKPNFLKTKPFISSWNYVSHKFFDCDGTESLGEGVFKFINITLAIASLFIYPLLVYSFCKLRDCCIQKQVRPLS